MNRHESRGLRAAGLSTDGRRRGRRWRSIHRLYGAVARLANVRIEALEDRRLLAADVAVAKFGAPDPVFAGNNLNYTVIVSNNGDVAARNVTLADALPAATTFVSATQTSGPAFSLSLPAAGASGGMFGGTIGQLNSGDVATFQIVTHVDAGTSNNTTLSNTATVAADADVDATNNSSTALTTVRTSADLVLTKTGPATVLTGGSVEYAITVVNNGPSDARSYSVNDPTPAGFGTRLFTQTSGPPVGGTLPAGATATFSARFEVASGTANNTAVTDTATTTSTTADPDATNNSASVTTTVLTPPALSVKKAGPSRAFAGDNVQYTITVQNAGGAPATHVVLSDLLPSQEFFVSQAETSGPAFTLTNAGNNVSDTVDSMPGLSTATFLVTARVNPAIFRNTTINNTATLTADQPPAADSGSSTTSLLAVPQADLVVTKSGPATVVAGMPVTYTVTLSNTGPSDAQFVRFADVLPGELTPVSFVQQSGPAFSLSFNGDHVYNAGRPSLGGGETAVFLVTATVNASVPAGTVVTNTAIANTSSTEPNTADDTASAASTVQAQADLALTKTGPATVVTGRLISYDITVTNTGPSDAQNYGISEVLPQGVSFVSLTQNSGPPLGGALPSGTTAAFTVTAQVGAGIANNTQLRNTATATSPTTDPNPANNSASVTTTAFTPADVSVAKAGPANVLAGNNIQYTITVRNKGGEPAANVTLSDLLPARESFVSQQQTAGPAFTLTNSGNQVADTIASMPGVSTATIVITARVDPSIFRTTSIPNTATVSMDQTDPVPSDNSASWTTLASAQADIVVTNTGPATVVAGTPVTYTVTLSNQGPSDAQLPRLADVLPADITPVSFVQQSGPAFNLSFNGDHGYNASRSTLSGGETAVFIVNGIVSPSAPAGESLANQAIALTSSPQPNTADDSATATSTVQTRADLAITKTGPATAVVGDVIQYDITVTNNGPSDAQQYNVTDALPSSATLVSFTQTSGPPLNQALPSGATATFTLTCKVGNVPADDDQYRDTASVRSPTFDPNTANNDASFATTVFTPANLSVKKVGPPAVAAGNNIQYTITVRNSTSVAAHNVTLSDLLPAREFFISQAQTDGPAFTLANAGNQLTDTIDTLPGLSTATFVITARVDPSIFRNTSLQNTATISSDLPDPDPSDNSSTTQTLASPQVDIVVTNTGPATVVAGTMVTYTVTLSNTGASDAQLVRLADVLPADVTPVSFVQQSGPAFSLSFNGDHVYNAGRPSLGGGETAVFLVTGTVSPSAPDGEALDNMAIANTSSTEPNTADDSATATSTVQTRADLQVIKTADPGPVFEGGTITYHVTVTNAGPSDAQNVKLIDAVPSGALFVSDTQTGGPAFTCSDPPAGGTGTISCAIPTLASGATATFTFVVRVPEEGSVSNTATVSTDTTDSDTTNNGATAIVVVQDLPLSLQSQPHLAGVEGTPINGVTVATFTDGNPDAPISDFTATIDWGDGTTSSATITQDAAKVFHVLGTHTYIDEGTFPVHVAINDEGGSTATADGSAVIADAPLSGSALPITGVEGSSLGSNVARFADSNPLAGPVDEYTAIILWGDGTSSAGTIVPDPGTANGFFVRGSHTYSSPGTFNTKVIVQDEGGASLALNGTATISPSTMSAFGRTIYARKKSPFLGVVGSFRDADSGNKDPGRYKITIDWGDGTAPTTGRAVFNPTTGRWDVFGLHTCSSKSPTSGFKVRITVISGSQFPPQFQSKTTIISTAIVSAGEGHDAEHPAAKKK